MYKDKEKQRAYWRDYERRNKEKRSAEHNNRRLKLLDMLNEYRATHPCGCGESDPICLDFHHTNGDKEISVALIPTRGWTPERMMEEVQKCIVLCANCHRKLHRDKKLSVLKLPL